MTTFGAVRLYGACLVTFLALDFLWLGVVARDFYRGQLGHLMSPTVRWPAAILFYLLFVAGVVVFVVLPALERASLGRALLLGGFFGLVTYATWDLTNLATLKGFPAALVPVDMAWGAALTAAVSGAGYLVATRFGGGG